ncbi:MAG TPA: PilW family protein [Gammaproteobacteria bacterium]|nr:PilW family protein [Gammaproteobacteria bacterium]
MKLFLETFHFRQQGITLVEVMLACALGLFLMAGLIQIGLAGKRTFTMQQAIINLQENGHYAVYFLNQHLRMAGYAGCESQPPFVKPESAIIGYENNLPAILQGKVVKGTDSVIVGGCYLENGKQRYNQYAYFISTTTRKNKLGKTIVSFYEMPIDGVKRELAANLERMKISYGLMTMDGKNIAGYESADKIKDWRQVRAVDISLLVSSEEPVLTKAESYQFAGETMPADRYLHREWHTYIALREKL